MLILTRRIGEALRIGSDIRIAVLSQHGRQEVFDQIQHERTAQTPAPSILTEG